MKTSRTREVLGAQGRLLFDYGLPAAGIKVRLYNVGFAGRDTLLQEAQADADGSYAFSYRLPRGTWANIQLRALDPENKEVTISATKFGAKASETLDLVVPERVRPLSAEYDRLATDMRSIGGPANLAHSAEGPKRQDLTLLNQSTGWDARLLALAATAAKQADGSGLRQDTFYALFRFGLPTDPAMLAMVPSATVEAVLVAAVTSGIVSMNREVSQATAAFQDFAGKTFLGTTAAGME